MRIFFWGGIPKFNKRNKDVVHLKDGLHLFSTMPPNNLPVTRCLQMLCKMSKVSAIYILQVTGKISHARHLL